LIKFNCHHCRQTFEAKDFNPLVMTIQCPSCGARNSISGALEPNYGRPVAEQAHKILQTLERLADKSKSSLVEPVNSAYLRIAQLCESACILA
jgi:hypothetical protein